MTATSETAPAARRAEDALHALSTLDPAELSGRKVIDGIAAGYQAISYLQAVMQGWMARLAEPGVIPSAEDLLKHPAKGSSAGQGSSAEQDTAEGSGTAAGKDSAAYENASARENACASEGVAAGQDTVSDENTATGEGNVPGEDTGEDDNTDAGSTSTGEDASAGEGLTADENTTAGQDHTGGDGNASERIYDLRASNPDSTAEFFDLMDTLEKAKARRDMVGGELAAALVLSPKSGSIYVQRAIDLVEELPDTLALLREGVLDQTRASMIHKYSCKLRDQTLLCEYERRALKVAPGRAPAKLEPLLERIITDLEPEDAAAAEKRAFNDRRTGRYDLEGAMARFYADLTAENAQLVQQLVDQIARTMGNAGGRTLEQCRADAFAAIFEQLHAHGTIDLREILAAAAHVAAGGDMPDDDDEVEAFDEGTDDEETDGKGTDSDTHDLADEDDADEGAGGVPDDRISDAGGDTEAPAAEPAADTDQSAEHHTDDEPSGTTGAEADSTGTGTETDPADPSATDDSATCDSDGADTEVDADEAVDNGPVGDGCDTTGATDHTEPSDTTEHLARTDTEADADEAVDNGPVGDGCDTTGATDHTEPSDTTEHLARTDTEADAEEAVDNGPVGDGCDTTGAADHPVDLIADRHGDAAEATNSRLAGVNAPAGSEPENRSDSEHPLAQGGSGCSESEPPDTDPAGNPERGTGDGGADSDDPPPFDPFRLDDPDAPRPSAPKWRAPVWQDRAVNPALPWNGVITISLQALAGLADHPGDMSGFGCISPDLARQLLKAANSITLLVIDPETGAPVGVSDRVYVPPGSLRRKVMLLTQTCSWVGCNRKAERCDVDHGEPFDHNNPAAGGKTTLRNLRPLCRFHHRLKTFTAWTTTEHADRTATLVSALGRTTRRPPPAVTDPGEWEPAWQTEDVDDDTPPF
ncbi:DUF222 domain-containing protein [Nakamurella sp. YIM 132087]|uniref:DUF222 domain-containing protein n=1 Tax=Nakamurella alba TaxID=2665158 RepID=A0A7K1FK94_9ACTN|nr:HNH endonuclease signature motif containing protein [Nakamurella alba]MTD13284.1 DUF222 domain-containing protein [Nakamurella alba]